MPSSTQCPAPEKLADFLFGSLAPEQASVLESHLSECSPCNDTLLELGSNDTFEQLAIEAFGDSPSNNVASSRTDLANINLVAAAAKAWSLQSQPNSRSTHAVEIEQAFDTDESSQCIGMFGQFRIEELLGAGSSSVVYLATDTTLNRQVALKILRPSLGDSAKARFLAEAKATAAMDHPNVVSIHHLGVEKGMAFIAMKWTPGQTLARRMKDGQPMPTEEVRDIGSQIANGLAAAHEANLIHRDIKPANIWLEEATGNVRILDFGLVRATNEEVSLTLTGMLAGTPSYMSPEQARGGELDSRSDLFSLGCVLYQMLSGKLPFCGNNILAMLQSVQKDAPRHPREFLKDSPEDLSALVMSLLQKSPDARPPSASMVAVAIQSDPSDWPFVPSVKPRTTKSKRRWNPLIAVGVLVAACVIGLAAFFAPQIIRIATDQGELQIETHDPNIKIEIVDTGGNVRVIDLKTNQSIDIKSGKYELRPVSDDNSVEVDRNTIVMKRGGKEIVRVTRSEITDEHHSDKVETSNNRGLDTSEFSDAKHLLQPGDIIGIAASNIPPDHLHDDDFYPLIVNARFEISYAGFSITELEGRRVWELPFLFQKAMRKNNSDIATRTEIKLLRKCPSPGELPTAETKIILFAPTHSQQVEESLRYHKLFLHQLLEDFGERHPSVISINKTIAKLTQFRTDLVVAERQIIEDKESLVRQKQEENPKWMEDPALNRDVSDLYLELYELEKAELVRDLNWILLSDRIPYGTGRVERRKYLEDRMDTVRTRGEQKIAEYSAKRKSLIAKGWHTDAEKLSLLDEYSQRLIPMILKSIETKDGRRLDKFQIANNPDIDLGNQRDDLPIGDPFILVKLVANGDSEKPIRSAQFQLYEISAGGYEEKLVSKGKADTSGNIEFKELNFGKRPDTYYKLLVRAIGYGSQQIALTPRSHLNKTGFADGGIDYEISFVEAEKLTGTIVNDSGKPVQGAVIYDICNQRVEPIDGFTTAQTNAEGKFCIEDLGPFSGPNPAYKCLRIRHPDYGPQYVNIEEIPGHVSIKLAPPVHVKFRVVDGDSGEPVADYRVGAQLTNDSRRHRKKGTYVGPADWIEATSDQEGWVRFIAPSTGSYNISHMSGPDEEKYPRVIELKSGIVGSVNLEPMKLAPAATITGNVVDESGNPVPNVSVCWYGPDRPQTSAMIRRVTTDDHGIFKAKVVPGENRLHISDAQWQLKDSRVYANGSWTAYSELGKDCTPGFIDVKRNSELQIQFIVSPRAQLDNLREVDRSTTVMKRDGKETARVARLEKLDQTHSGEATIASNTVTQSTSKESQLEPSEAESTTSPRPKEAALQREGTRLKQGLLRAITMRDNARRKANDTTAIEAAKKQVELTRKRYVTTEKLIEKGFRMAAEKTREKSELDISILQLEKALIDQDSALGEAKLQSVRIADFKRRIKLHQAKVAGESEDSLSDELTSLNHKLRLALIRKDNAKRKVDDNTTTIKIIQKQVEHSKKLLDIAEKQVSSGSHPMHVKTQAKFEFEVSRLRLEAALSEHKSDRGEVELESAVVAEIKLQIELHKAKGANEATTNSTDSRSDNDLTLLKHQLHQINVRRRIAALIAKTTYKF